MTFGFVPGLAFLKKKPSFIGRKSTRARSSRSDGFSEEALRGLDDLDARSPPPGAEMKPAFAQSFKQSLRTVVREFSGDGGARGACG